LDTSLCNVETVDGKYFVRWLDGRTTLITMGLTPAALPQGWSPLFVYTGFAPVFLVELRHETGAESTWFLNQEMDRVAYDDPNQLPPSLLGIFHQKCRLLARQVWKQLLCAVHPILSPEIQSFFQLGPTIRRRIAFFCGSEFNHRPHFFDLRPVHSTPLKLPLSATLSVDTGRLQEIIGPNPSDMSTHHYDQCMTQIPTGLLSWPSPIDGKTLNTDCGLWINDYLFAYRLIDRRANCAIYILTSGNPRSVAAIYFPAHNQVFGYDPFYRAFIGDRYDVALDVLFVRHLLEYGDSIVNCWNAPKRAFAAMYSQRMLGTQLWWDLTGIDHMLRRLSRDDIPEILAVWLPTEIYGKVDELFPELAGRVNRAVRGYHAEFIRYSYDNCRCLLSLANNYVTRGLAKRILDHNLHQASLHGQPERLKAVQERGGPIVLLGLRVENRTLVDLTGFCVSVIDYFIRTVGTVTIIIDGHNSTDHDASSGVYASEFQQLATEEPIDVERRIVALLEQQFSGSPAILINNIGAPISHSLFWCHHSDFFVTPYGTGLAKYCWACNKTGLIVTSRWTLHHQGHLHIYESDFVEEPAPIRFLPEEYVEDVPEAPLLVPHPVDPPSRWNFRVNTEGLFKELGDLLVRTGFTGK